MCIILMSDARRTKENLFSEITKKLNLVSTTQRSEPFSDRAMTLNANQSIPLGDASASP